MAVLQIRASLAFVKGPAAGVVARGTAVYLGVYGNPHFVNPPVEAAVLKGAIDALAAAIPEALDGSRKAVADKNRKQTALVKMLKLLARYVEVNCQDDMGIFTSSGFEPVAATRTAPLPLGPATIHDVVQGLSGQLLGKIDSLPKTLHFDFRFGVLENGVVANWTTLMVTGVRTPVVINGLTPGKTYAFQVRAYGKLGYTDWSDSVVRMCT